MGFRGLTFEMPKSDKGKHAKLRRTYANALQCKMKAPLILWKQ